MNHAVTQLIEAARAGDRQAAADLLPLVYDELRRLAASRMSNEAPGRTIQATALVHEAYLRLVGSADGEKWEGRAHFFGAAAEAMRRILVDNARRRLSQKRGGDARRVALDDIEPAADPDDPLGSLNLVALDKALDQLKQVDGTAAELVQLRFFAGLTMQDAAQALDIPLRRAERTWSYARAWLFREISGETGVD